MASIYEIPNWSASVTYSKNSIAYDSHATGAEYYYVISESVTSSTKPHNDSTNWGGHTTYNNKKVPHFFWVPSYTASISTEPQVEVIKFGDGYEQRTPQNVNSELIKISLGFDKRGEKETTAIAHFLNIRAAQEAFAFTPPSPYGSTKLFVCRSWDVTMNFEDNYSIKANFEEVVE